MKQIAIAQRTYVRH